MAKDSALPPADAMPLDLTKKGLARHKQRRAVATVRNDVDRAIRVMTIGYLGAQEEKRNALTQKLAALTSAETGMVTSTNGADDPRVATAPESEEFQRAAGSSPTSVKSSADLQLAPTQETIESAEAALAAALRFAASVGTKASKRTEELVRRAISQQRVLEDASDLVESLQGESGASWEAQKSDSVYPNFRQHDAAASYSTALGESGDHSKQGMHPPHLQRAVTDLHCQTNRLSTPNSASESYTVSETGPTQDPAQNCSLNQVSLPHRAEIALGQHQGLVPELFASTESLSFASATQNSPDLATAKVTKARSSTAQLQSSGLAARVGECETPILSQRVQGLQTQTAGDPEHLPPTSGEAQMQGSLVRLPSATLAISPQLQALPDPEHRSLQPNSTAHPDVQRAQFRMSSAASLRAEINAALESGSWETIDNDAIEPDACGLRRQLEGFRNHAQIAERYSSTPGERYREPQRDYTHAEWQRRHVRYMEALSRSGISQAELLAIQVRSAAAALSPHQHMHPQLPPDENEVSAARSTDTTILLRQTEALNRVLPVDHRSPDVTRQGSSSRVNHELGMQSQDSRHLATPVSPDNDFHRPPTHRSGTRDIPAPSPSNARTGVAVADVANLSSLHSMSRAETTAPKSSHTALRFSPESCKSSTSSTAAIAALACAIGVRGIPPATANPSGSSTSSLGSIPNLSNQGSQRIMPGAQAKLQANINPNASVGTSPAPSPHTPLARQQSANSLGESNFASMRAALSAASASLQTLPQDDPERVAFLAATSIAASGSTGVSNSINSDHGSAERKNPSRPNQPLRFQRLGKLGQGAVGEVYRCSLTENGMHVAVKEAPSTDRKNRERVIREGRIMQELVHPNIICFFGSQDTEEGARIFMELAAGGSVHQRISEAGPLDPALMRLITIGVLGALAYMHSRGLIHCDIKCQNILLTAEGHVKVADFGAARWYEAYPESEMTDDNKRLKDAANMLVAEGGKRCDHFTVKWTAPEVLRGEECTPVADIWSLGCALVEMTNGRSPWYNCGFKTDAEAQNYIAFEDKIPDFSEESLPPFASDFIKLCLTRNPNRRPTAAQLLKHPWITTPPQPASTKIGSLVSVPTVDPPAGAAASPASVLVPAFEEAENPKFDKLLARSKAMEQRPFKQTTFSPGTYSSPSGVHHNSLVSNGPGSPIQLGSTAASAGQTAGSHSSAAAAAGLMPAYPSKSDVLVPAVIAQPASAVQLFPATSNISPASTGPAPTKLASEPSFDAGLLPGRLSTTPMHHALTPSSDTNSAHARQSVETMISPRSDLSLHDVSYMSPVSLPTFSSTPSAQAQAIGAQPAVAAGPVPKAADSEMSPQHAPILLLASTIQAPQSSIVNPTETKNQSSSHCAIGSQLVSIGNHEEGELSSEQSQLTKSCTITEHAVTTTPVGEGAVGTTLDYENIDSLTPGSSPGVGPTSEVIPAPALGQNATLAPSHPVPGGARVISTIAEENSQRSSSGSSLHSANFSSLDASGWGVQAQEGKRTSADARDFLGSAASLTVHDSHAPSGTYPKSSSTVNNVTHTAASFNHKPSLPRHDEDATVRVGTGLVRPNHIVQVHQDLQNLAHKTPMTSVPSNMNYAKNPLN